MNTWPSGAKHAPFYLMNQLFFWPVHINIFVCVDFAVHWEKETDDRSYVHFCYVYNYHIENSLQSIYLFTLHEGKQHIKHSLREDTRGGLLMLF